MSLILFSLHGGFIIQAEPIKSPAIGEPLFLEHISPPHKTGFQPHLSYHVLVFFGTSSHLKPSVGLLINTQMTPIALEMTSREH